jgi:hypothetical protein
VRPFSVDLEVSQIVKLAGLNCITIDRNLKGIRQYCSAKSQFSGEIEVEESLFRAPCIKDKRGRGGFGKTIVFGIFQRNGHVHTAIAQDCKKATL